jgi:glycosyltransferase involved in cell wall biosynthesis
MTHPFMTHPSITTDPRTRIALFVPNLDGGGAERMMVHLASGFAERGFQTDLVLAEARGPYLDKVAPRVVDLKSAGVSAGLPKLVRYLRRWRPTSLLATLSHASVIAVLGRKLAAVPIRVVIRESNMLFPYQTPGLRLSRLGALKAAVRLLYPLSDAHIAVSHGIARNLQSFARLRAEKVHTIYNPVATRKVLEQAHLVPNHPWLGAEATGKPGQPPVFLGVGRLGGQKDFATLLRAFTEVRRLCPARLIILGEGEKRADLEALALELGVANDVSLPGFVDNPFAFMARADTFVLSSRFEGLSGALIQAMACGCRVVSTNCPSGPSEILQGGALAPLVGIGDVSGLSAAMLASLMAPANPALRARALDFSEEKIIPQYLEVLLPRQARRIASLQRVGAHLNASDPSAPARPV